MVVFNSALIIASMNLRRRLEKEKEREIEKKKKEEKNRKYPFKNKVIEGEQIEIYPYYMVKMVKEYKIEEDGQINILEKVYRPKEIIKYYKMEIGNKIEIIQENY